jgi:mono/diheme cytochrome c family protein
MNGGLNPSSSTSPDLAPPSAQRQPVPVWLFVLLFVMLYWGMVYFDQRSGWFAAEVYTPYRSVVELQIYQPIGTGPGPGKAIFESNCALCHNSDGTGKPGQGPPFVGSEWVLGSPNRMIRIPENGLTGPVKVKDQEYNLNMAGMGHDLKDADLAAVLSYIRSSWGNKASAITPAQVKAVRAEVGNRNQPWTAKELESIQ